jgi:hypothetical protein
MPVAGCVNYFLFHFPQAQQAFHMPTHTLMRKDSSLPAALPTVQAQQAQQAFAMPTHLISRKNSPNMPTVGEDSDGSGGATNRAQALYAAIGPAAPNDAPAAEPGPTSAPAQPEEAASATAAAGTPQKQLRGGAAPDVGAASPSEAARPPLPTVPSGAAICLLPTLP